jgi:hypothetical protein
MLPAVQAGSKAKTTLLVFAALPICMYFFFLFYYLALDVLLAILSIPAKLDALAGNEGAAKPEASVESDRTGFDSGDPT